MTHFRSWPPLFSPLDLVKGTLLCVAPHPDDEVIGPGGLVMAHCDRGERVVTVIMTDGSRGDGAEAEAYVETRRAESRAASEVLGGTELRFLEYADGSLARLLDDAEADLAGRLKAIIDEVEPATVLFPSPYEFHPDHRASALATARALEVAACQPRLLAYEVGEMMPVNVLINTTDWFERKCTALDRFESQLGAHDLKGKMEALNRARTVNCDDRAVMHAEAYLRIDPARLGELCERVERLLETTDQMMPPIPYE